jgi:hypothetical protein
MKTIAALGASLFLIAAPASAQNDRGFVRGLAGLTFGTESSTLFGAGLGWNIGPNLQITADIGRMQNVMPSEIQEELDLFVELTELDLGVPIEFEARIPAFYFTGGVRLNVPTMQRFRPFVEGAGGVGRISADFHVEIDGEDVSDELTDEVDLEPESKFMLMFGGGLAFDLSQNVGVDVGYRFHRIFTEDPAINASAVYAAIRWNLR